MLYAMSSCEESMLESSASDSTPALLGRMAGLRPAVLSTSSNLVRLVFKPLREATSSLVTTITNGTPSLKQRSS